MERKNFLIDTNIAIYYFGLLLSESSESFLDLLIRKSYYISVINRIELLGFSKLDRNQYSVKVSRLWFLVSRFSFANSGYKSTGHGTQGGGQRAQGKS
jgi:hypothetical protein